MLGLRLVEEAHQETLHGGVGLTMAKVRTRCWIPKLRQLGKKVHKSCHGCKRFQASAYATPPPGNLPTNRTQGTNLYQVIGVDYAGPIRYRVSKQREGKAYVLLYACSLTQGIYLDLLPNLETAECLKSMKQFTARQGRPERIYSDNGQTFVGAANWFRAVMADERQQTYLSINQIKWQFNLSRVPWWGGKFEQLIGLVKAALNKTIGNGHKRRRAQRGAGGDTPAVGDVFIIMTQDKNRGKWPLRIIESLIMGNDRVVRGAKLRVGKSKVDVLFNNFTPWNCCVTDRCQYHGRG